jgi:hypothetical protein
MSGGLGPDAWSFSVVRMSLNVLAVRFSVTFGYLALSVS